MSIQGLSLVRLIGSRCYQFSTFGCALLICISLCSCDSSNHTNELRQQLSSHRVHNIDVWQDYLKKAPITRVEAAPPLLIDYLQIDNRLNGYSTTPTAPDHWQPVAEDVVAAIDAFPPAVRDLFDQYVIGVFFVSGLGSSAYTDFLLEHNQHKMGVIVLDTQILNMKANAWATWKENTPFQAAKGMNLELNIAGKGEGNRTTALSYIVLHELGHLVALNKNAHANWSGSGDQNPSNYSFSSISWKMNKGKVEPKSSPLFPERKTIHYYAPPEMRISATHLPSIYHNWHKTDFVSLYAAMNVYDDFAETFAMYVHVVMQGQSWKLTLTKDGNIIESFDNPILQPRCSEKKAYMDTILKRSPIAPESRRSSNEII